MKFKVGDKVRVKATGVVGRIDFANEKFHPPYGIKGNTGMYDEHELESV